MKSLTSLWSITAEELAVRCCTSASRDIKTVVARTEHEGLSFLAITLADLGKAIEKWLDQGFVVPSDCATFALKRRQGSRTGLPAFLSGFLGRVFDPSSGALMDDPDIEAIYAVRQLTLMFSKIALPVGIPIKGAQLRHHDRQVVSAARERRAMFEFVHCEQDVKAADARLDPAYKAEFKRMSAMLFGEMFTELEQRVQWGQLTPKHGPGAVAEKVGSNAKFDQHTWPARLDRYFPAEWHLIPNLKYMRKLRSRLNILEPGAEVPVRVISVPKTLKKPRIIAIEPTAMQYAQQSLFRAILDSVRKDGFLSRVIGIDDQEPNRQMAFRGSLSGELATLDLSEASDRVSNQHVLAMLEDWPRLSEAVQSCRSRKADVPGYGVIRLAKFASMGSALCFPMESLVFMTVILLGIEREQSAPLSRRQVVNLFSEQVRVFGDDLIVPRDYVLSVVSELETFGFQVNAGKSFWSGRFRESCGREYYDGVDVSIVRVRRELPTRQQDAGGVNSAVEFRNLAYKAGLWQTARWMDNYLRKILRYFPNVASSSPLLGRFSYLGYEFQTLDPKTQGPITKGLFLSSEAPKDPLSGYGALLKCLLQMEERSSSEIDAVRLAKADLSSVDPEHLERSGRPRHVGIKPGWRSPF